MDKLDKDIISLIEELYKLSYQRWLEREFFTWQWWVLIALFIVSWLIGIKYIDHKNKFKILAYGFITATVTLLLDAWGGNSGTMVLSY